MSGICGFVCRETGKVPPGTIREMAGKMVSSPEDPVDTIDFDSGSFGNFLRASCFVGVAKVVLPQGAITVAWDGAFLNPELIGSRKVGEEKRDVGKFLAELYSRFGDGMFSRLQGDFIVALWDPREKRLMAACDRFRVKPLYYYSDDNCMVFGSKLKALSVHPLVPWRINPGAIADFLDMSVIPTPETICRDIRKIQPGSLLVWQDGVLHLTRYWDIRYTEDDSKSEEEYASGVRDLLKSSVEDRLAVVDGGGAVGAFLSGGVDSTAIVGLLHGSIGKRVEAFSIGFSEDRFNEMEYARIAARWFGVRHHEYFVTPADTYDLIPKIAAEYDEPFGNSSAVPTYYCVKMAKEAGMCAIFAGDGGDELFAGNERYAHDKLFQSYRHVPSLIRKGFLDPIAPLLSRTGVPGIAKAGKYICRSNIQCPDRWFSYSPTNTIPILAEMLTKDLRDVVNARVPLSHYKEVYRDAIATTEFSRFLYLDLKSAIADNDLLKVTRMSELGGLDVQFPFLCHRLAELAGAIPSHLMMRGFRLRSFFKKAFSELLPRETITKKKHGFGLPIPIWLREDKRLRDLASELVLSARSVQRGYFRKEFLERIFDAHRTDTTSFYGSVIWNLMMLELWHRNYWDQGVG